MKIVLLGKPASGKGTQGEKICELYNLEYISTGNIFRENIKSETELGHRVKEVIAKGELVSDNLVIELVQEYLKTRTDNLLFDGFPRTLTQAKALKEMMNIDVIINVEIPNEVAIRRVTSRRVCKNGHTYSLLFKRPRHEGVCDICQEPLFQREDDREEVIKNRLAEYEQLTKPILEFYEIQTVDGTQQIDKVTEDIKSILQSQ